MASESSTNKSAEEGWIVKFVPFSSAIESPFWVRYCREKLETIQLNEDPISLSALYGIADTTSQPRLQCHESNWSLTTNFQQNETVLVNLTLQGFNTLESFQKCDKNKLLSDFFMPSFLRGELSALTSVYLCVYPELKSHKVLYWMAIPALLTKSGKAVRAMKQTPFVDSAWTKEERKTLAINIDTMRQTSLKEKGGGGGLPPFFLCTKTTCTTLDLSSYHKILQTEKEEVMFGFFDPVGATTTKLEPQECMGWPLRNLVAYLSHHCDLGGQKVKVLSYRPKRVRRIVVEGDDTPKETTTIEDDAADHSILLEIMVPTKEDYEWPPSSGGSTTTAETTKVVHKVVGWELNARNKPGPRWVNLRPLLDTNHLAVQAADLNLKLMKWRMIPDLQVERLQQTKVLVIGAGTLGCSVARVLIGWGIRHIKLIDYGKVSYSNPVRQSLFTLEDCHYDNGTGRSKAQAASDALKKIAADMQSEGTTLSIPMPGHPEPRQTMEESVETLDKLVQECDAVFLLTDTRESRWLPTLMAATHDKLLINAALGLDSWLVMRHGGGGSSMTENGRRLGCYFCNDIVAPENSTKNRTLDQQCTVTRPGLAPIASSMAAELMVSLLHHPQRHAAPAPTTTTTAAGGAAFSPTASANDPSSLGPLGIIPHQIRGSLVSYTMMTPTVPAFVHCTACATSVIDAYRQDKMDLVFNTCQSKDGEYLETISGLTDYRAKAAKKAAEMEEDVWDDDDDDDDDHENDN